MNKFYYGEFDSDNDDIAFISSKGYVSPASEVAVRKQLSYPLKEIKDYINDTVSEDSNGNAIQIVLDNGELKYRTEPNGELHGIGGFSIDSIYPVGSIYMSVNSANPSTLFPDTTWEQLKDRFLLGAGDTYTAGTTGGEATHTLTVDEMPSHSHTQTAGTRYNSGGSGSSIYEATGTSSTGSTGGGQAHNNMPPYLVVYMWKRTA